MIKKLLIAIILIVVSTFGYIFVTAFKEGKAQADQENRKIDASISTTVTSLNQWGVTAKAGQVKYGSKYYLSSDFQGMTAATLQSLQQAQQSLPPPPPQSSKVYPDDLEMRKFLSDEIQEMQTLLTASKAGQLNTIAAVLKTHDTRIQDHKAKMATN